MLSGVWLQNWTLEGAALHSEERWTFVGLIQVPFGDKDAKRVRRRMTEIREEARQLGAESWWKRHVHRSTQLAEGAPLGPADHPPWNPAWRPDPYAGPWALRRGPTNPDRGDLYPGVDVDKVEARLHAFVRSSLRGNLLTWREDPPWFAYRCFTVFFLSNPTLC